MPFEKGLKKYGVSVAPAAIRTAVLIAELQGTEKLDVKDHGDIHIAVQTQNTAVHNMNHLSLVSKCNETLSKKVTEVLKEDRMFITIGGDHSIVVGTVDSHNHVHENLILIWVGHQADINTNKTSESGSLHGMTVALIAHGLIDPTLDWHKPTLSIKSLGFGLRFSRPVREACDRQIPNLWFCFGGYR